MTLFANSGVAWPRHEAETKDAGQKSLEAASGLFRILASLEAESHPAKLGDYELNRCAESLDQAAQIYARVGDELSREAVRQMSASEFELAAIPRYRRGYADEEFEVSPYPYRGRLLVGDLYKDLSHRLRRLASAIRALKTSERSFDLAPQVFDMLRLWESISSLARLIATLGRRTAQSGG